MGYLRAKDTVNGALGTCFAIIDGKRHELMQVKNVQAKVKKTRYTLTGALLATVAGIAASVCLAGVV